MFNEYNTKVTLELRDLINSGCKIWDFEYPSFYTGDAKKAFEQKVIDHYYFRQIGQETPGRWLHYFRTRIREIMPYYIDLYKTDELFKSIDDPFKSYDLTEEFSKSSSSESTSNGSSESTSNTSSNSSEQTNNEHRHSDTPQGSIDNIDKYMSEASRDNNNVNTEGSTDSTSTGTTSGTSTGSGEEEYTLKRYGNIGVQPLGDEVQKLRNAYINIDMMIIEELNDLFLKVY